MEACVTLLKVRLKLSIYPFKQLVDVSETTRVQASDSCIHETTDSAATIGKMIETSAHYTLWESSCLVRALTAKEMLRRRGIGGIIYLGVKKSEEVKAHAWSVCGETILTGAKGHESFEVISSFPWEGRQ